VDGQPAGPVRKPAERGPGTGRELVEGGAFVGKLAGERLVVGVVRLRVNFAEAFGIEEFALIIKRELAFFPFDLGEAFGAGIFQRLADAGFARQEGRLEVFPLLGCVGVDFLGSGGPAGAFGGEGLLQLDTQLVSPRGEVTLHFSGALDGFAYALAQAVEQRQGLGNAQQFIHSRCGFWRGLVQGIQCC
jgi:hypothetical protein